MMAPVANNAAAPPTNLPKLPVPPVKDTLGRYLDAIKAVVTEDEYLRTEIKCGEFLSDQQLVKEVEEFLSKRREEHDNWALQYWLEDMYLRNPIALPINSNPSAVIHQGLCFSSEDERSAYIGRFVVSYLMEKDKVESGKFPHDVIPSRSGGSAPLCMEQYWRVFNAYRYPHEECDTLVFEDARVAKPREHIVVMRKCRMFVVTVKEDGEWIDSATLGAIVKHISVLDLPHLAMRERVSLLTATDRPKWASNRKALMEDPASAEAMRTVETSLFILCLDEATQSESDEKRSEKSQLLQMMCGEGPHKNGYNRWYDKAFHIIFTSDGTIGVNIEHSVAEGLVLAALRNATLKKMEVEEKQVEFDLANMDASAWEWRFKRLEFPNAGKKHIREAVRSAAEDFERLCNDTDLEVFTFRDFAKSYMGALKLSPDGFVQMALQLAYYRTSGGETCFTYESGSTRKFRKGRVDNIRSSHPEAKAWVKAMEDKSCSNKERLGLLKAALMKQGKVSIENIRGMGMDIPLLGIRNACHELRPNESIALFEDEVYAKSNYFKLSTSQVTFELPYPQGVTGYGAVVPDGYGVSYNLHDDFILFHVASFFSSEETNSLEMTRMIKKSLWDIRLLLESAK